jgi:hypothetical protein
MRLRDHVTYRDMRAQLAVDRALSHIFVFLSLCPPLNCGTKCERHEQTQK